MKNIKNMISAAGLMAVMVIGTVSANTGILIHDKTATGSEGQCMPVKDNDALQNLDGIIIVGFQSALEGIINISKAGLPISDNGTVCNQNDQAKDGILIHD